MLYEITLTLRPQMYRYDSKEQYVMCKPLLDKVFKRSDPKASYKVSLVAELTSEDNIHFHGIIDLTDFGHRHRLINNLRQFHTIFGRKSISQLVDYSKWVEYINKDKSKTRKLLGCPIVYDDHVVLCDPQYRFGNPDS